MSNASEPILFRLRVAYPKLGRLKYLGHLELIHTVEQIVRRAALPYAVTQGFSPHMRIAYTSALPVGTSSAAEYFDVYLTELVPASDALGRLQDSSPVDMRPMAASYVELRRPALTAEIDRVRYLIELTFRPGRAPRDGRVLEIVSSWLDSAIEIPYRRGKKVKSLDVRKTMSGASVTASDDGGIWMELATRCDNEGSLRPEIFVVALDQALSGLVPGVDEEIVSTGIQQLKTIESYQVERASQAISQEGGSELGPLGRQLVAPEGSLVRCARGEVLSNL